LHTPVPVIGPRLATEDTFLGETFVPKGSTVVIDVMSLHRNPKVWSHPDKFDPERFALGGEIEKHAGSGMTYTPFGGGARHCIGRKFALNEQKVLLSMFCKYL
jgi:cytochrome P450